MKSRLGNRAAFHFQTPAALKGAKFAKKDWRTMSSIIFAPFAAFCLFFVFFVAMISI
jgi:hypothetical protein